MPPSESQLVTSSVSDLPACNTILLASNVFAVMDTAPPAVSKQLVNVAVDAVSVNDPTPLETTPLPRKLFAQIVAPWSINRPSLMNAPYGTANEARLVEPATDLPPPPGRFSYCQSTLDW